MKHFLVPIFCFVVLPTSVLGADDKVDAPQTVKHQVTGLFAPDREGDLREVFEKIPQIKLASIDFKKAEITCEYRPSKVFPNAKPEQVIERFDEMVKAASNHTFGVKPLPKLPLDKLKWIEISVAGLDCKACCLAAYEAVFKLEGVERATASFKEGRMTVLIDPEKTDRAKLEAVLKQRGVQLKSP